MPNYLYRGYDENQKIVKGSMMGPDLVTATERIRKRQVTPITIKEKEAPIEVLAARKKFHDQELINFCGHLGLMIKSGVNILTSLEIMEQQSTNKAIKKIYNEILDHVKKGESLSNCLEDTKEFPGLLVGMVKVGEATGGLDTILFNMEEYYQRDLTMKNKIKTATVYPKILIFATIATILFFLYFVVPTFSDLFSDMETLPLPTRFLMGFTAFIQSNTLYLLGGFLVLGLIFLGIRRQEKYILFKDQVMLSIPFLGHFKKQVIISRMARSLGVFLKSGVPILNSLEDTKNVLKNKFMEKRFDSAITKIMNGKSIPDAFEEEKMFEPMVYGLMRVGQETGNLDEMLYRLAEIYDREVEFALSKLVAKIEPIMILIIGAVVGFIVIAIAVPILTMSQSIG